MRNGFALLVAGALFLSPMLAESLLGQQQGGAQPPASQQGGRQGQPGATAPAAPQGDGARQGGGGGGRGGGGRGGRAAVPAAPAPRRPDGRVYLGAATTKEKGLWLPPGLPPLVDAKIVPFMPWSKAVFEDRLKNELEPHTRCKASGVARQFLTPYGVEFLELEDQKRIYIFDVGGPHTFRTIFMDGREHPKDLVPSYYGHNVGHWEGDTLVVDTVGFVESFWLDRRGTPHTDKLHTIEKFTRLDSANMKYEVTIDDPGAYTAPFTGGFNLRWENGTELFEYVCQEANQAFTLMVGTAESVNRSTPIVP
jgi:hypothetical protein